MMKLLDRLISFIFSLLFLVLAIVLILIGTGIIEPEMCLELVRDNFLNGDVVSTGFFNPITITGLVLLLLSLKTTVFLSLFKVKNRAPIAVENGEGEIQITQETIINTARSNTLEYENVREVQAGMAKKGKGIVIYETIQVYMNTNIRELTEAIQESVKKIVYATTGISVLKVNIKVKNVYNGKRKDDVEKQQPADEPAPIKVEAPKMVEEVKTTAIESATVEPINVDKIVEEAEKEETKE